MRQARGALMHDEFPLAPLPGRIIARVCSAATHQRPRSGGGGAVHEALPPRLELLVLVVLMVGLVEVLRLLLLLGGALPAVTHRATGAAGRVVCGWQRATCKAGSDSEEIR